MRRQQDPPDHTRLRSLVNKAFTRQAVNLLEPRIRGLMAALLDDIDDPAGFDLMKAVAIAVRNVSGRRRWSKLNEWLGDASGGDVGSRVALSSSY